MPSIEEDHIIADAKFVDTFWKGFNKPKTLQNVVQHFATTYPNADKNARDVFTQEIVEGQIIMKKVDKRKLRELINYEMSKTNTSKNLTQKNNTTIQDEKMSIFHADRLDGHAFQEFVAEILKHDGYTGVEVTGKSGDQGGDILAEKDGKSLVIQVKRYSIDSKVSNSAVQEAYGAIAYYNTDVGAVITNTLYTKGARDLADKTGIILWDRQDLTRLVTKFNKVKSTKDSHDV